MPWTESPASDAGASAGADGAASDAVTSSIDLLSLMDPARDSRNGVWDIEGGNLLSPTQAQTVCTFPRRVAGPFKLTVLAERIQGNEALNVVVPFAGRPAMVVLEGFGNMSSGINKVRNLPANMNPTSMKGVVFHPGQPARIVFLVSGNTISVNCNDQLRFSWSGSPQAIELDERYWSGLPGDQVSLTVFTATTRFRISRATLEPLSEFEKGDLAKRSSQDPPAGVRPPRGRFEPPFGARSSGGFPPATASSSQETLPSAPTAPPPEEALNRKESVCLIETAKGTGSGFVLANNIVATNAHVVNDVFVEEIKLVFGAQRSQTFRVNRILYEDPLRDICLLEAAVPAPAIPLVANHTFQRGEQVVIIGNPVLGKTDVVLRDAVTTGPISAVVHAKGCDFYQIHATINPGSSGGPVLNARGEVTGIVAMKATETGQREIHQALTRLDKAIASHVRLVSGQGIAFAIPAPVVAEALDEAQNADSTQLAKVADWHQARVVFQRSAALGAIYFLKFCTNVPPSVREQERNIQTGRIPAAAARQIKRVELLSQPQAASLARALESEEVAKLVRVFSTGLNEKLQALQASSQLPEDTLRALGDLQRAVNRNKGLAENPPSSYQNYSKAFHDQRDLLKQLVDRLSEQLRIEEAGYGQ